MTLEVMFAGLLVAALAGWSWFLVAYSRATLDSAKAWETLERTGSKIDARVDNAVSRILNRVKLKAGASEEEGGFGPTVLDDEAEAARELLRSGIPPHLRGQTTPTEEGPPLGPLGEMPVES